MALENCQSCVYCGTQNDQGEPHCRSCGEPLEIQPPEKPAVDQERQEAGISGALSDLAARAATEPSPTGAQGAPEASSPPPVNRFYGYMRGHWRGDQSLALTYWVNGMAVTFLMTGCVKAFLWAIEDVDLRLSSALKLLCFGVIIAISIWQLVGIWRSAAHHTSRGGGVFWAGCARLLVLIGLLRLVLIFSNTVLPQSSEFLTIIGGDQRMPPYEINVLANGKEIEFRGGMRVGCSQALEEVLEKYPQATVLRIESGGGRVAEATRMRDLVQKRGLITYTSRTCQSAATLVLISSKERVVAAGAKVGFHASSFPGTTPEHRLKIDQRMRSVMQAAGVSPAFIEKALSTPHEDMWYPTIEEMIAAGVVTAKTQGERFSAGISDKDLAAVLQTLESNPLYVTIRTYEPAIFQEMKARLIASIKSGQSETEALSTLSELGSSLLDKYLATAGDEALLGMRDHWLDILVRYKDKQSRACVAVFANENISFRRAFPDWDDTKSISILNEVIRSGASKSAPKLDMKAAHEDLEKILLPLAEEYGEDLHLLGEPSKWKDHPEQTCEILYSVYKSTTHLPKTRAANLIRYIVSDTEE